MLLLQKQILHFRLFSMQQNEHVHKIGLSIDF